MKLRYPSNNSSLHKSIVMALLVAAVLLVFEIHLLTTAPWSGLVLKPASERINGVVVTAVRHPELLHKLQAGDHILALKSENLGYSHLNAHTLMLEPDNNPTLAEYQAVFHQNALLYERLNDGLITAKMADGRAISFMPRPSRPVTELPVAFWVINLTVLIALLFVAVIGAYRQQGLTTRLLMLTGLSFAIASTTSAIYSSRGLALDPDWFLILTAINNLAMPLVAYSLLALVMVYPHRLVPLSGVIVCLLIPVLLWLNILFQWYDLPFHTFYLGMILAFFSGILPAVRQWQLSRNKPLQRAALKWMLLSIYIASGSEVFLYFMPTLLRQPPALPLWLAQLIFLPLYIGFILGVMRVRLFDVERWWLLSWQWVLGGLLIVGIDLLLVSVLHLHALGALSIAVILVAWIYFPLRQWLWQRLGHPHEPHLESYIHDFIQTFVGDKQTDAKERWRTLLQRIFSASSAEISGGHLAAPQISEEGMALLIPGVDGNYHIDLYGKQDASRLFSQRDIRLSQTLNELAAYTTSLQQAKQQSQANERNRIMRDLHDDVGANLVSMIYRANNQDQAQLAKDTLTLLRETIYTLDDHSSTRLPLAIAKWRQEIQQRCQPADVHLDWRTEDIPARYELDARQLVNLGRVLREIFTNALKHAQPGQFKVHFQVEADWLHIRVRHNGNIKPPDTWTEGKGLPGIRTRIKELHGKIRWQLTDYLEARIAIPIHRKHTHESTA